MILCCSVNSICAEDKYVEIDLLNGDCKRLNSKVLSTKLKITKRPSIAFNKSNFINIKTRSIFEDYVINEKLGEGKTALIEGSYGCVYRVMHRKTNLTRAVKAIRRSNIDEKTFQNEIDILSTLDHPNIIRLFECYLDDNYYYMVQE